MVGPAGGSAVRSFILREEPTESRRSERGQFSAEPFQWPRSSYDQRRIGSPVIGWVGLLAGLRRVGFCGSVTRDKLWSDPHARLELKLIAAAARCPNRSLGQPPRWLLINDSGASRTPLHEIGRKE